MQIITIQLNFLTLWSYFVFEFTAAALSDAYFIAVCYHVQKLDSDYTPAWSRSDWKCVVLLRWVPFLFIFHRYKFKKKIGFLRRIKFDEWIKSENKKQLIGKKIEKSTNFEANESGWEKEKEEEEERSCGGSEEKKEAKGSSIAGIPHSPRASSASSKNICMHASLFLHYMA